MERVDSIKRWNWKQGDKNPFCTLTLRKELVGRGQPDGRGGSDMDEVELSMDRLSRHPDGHPPSLHSNPSTFKTSFSRARLVQHLATDSGQLLVQ